MVKKEGYLTKQGESFLFLAGKWQRRWFVLDDMNFTMRYFEERGVETSLKGQIDLKGGSVIESRDCLELKKKDFCFGINTLSARTYYMFAEHAGDARDWVSAIKEVIGLAKKAARKSNQGDQGDLRSRPGLGLASDFVVVDVHERHKIELAHQYSTEMVEELDLHPALISLTDQFLKLRKEQPVQFTQGANTEKTRVRVQKLLYGDRSKYNSEEAFQKSIVSWNSSTTCTACSAGYSLLKSKTHCKLCGDTVCDADTCCNVFELVDIGKLVNVLQGRPTCPRDLAISICASCEENVNQAARTSRLDKGQEKKTPMQKLYKEACSLKVQTAREILHYEDLIKQILGGNTAPAVRDQAKEMHGHILDSLKTLTHTTLTLEKLPVKDKRSQRQRFQSSVHLAFNTWAKEMKYHVNSFAESIKL
eukprot:m.1853 g.1853  ORF g.1853 m.1853 type:complete len:420 (+) comp1649_c0_seq1:115-1374(+)